MIFVKKKGKLFKAELFSVISVSGGLKP